MKKWITAIIILIVIAIVAFYLFLPTPAAVSGITGIKSSSAGAYRILSNESKWKQYSHNNFTLSGKLLNTIVVSYRTNTDSLPVNIIFIPITNDSVELNWESKIPEMNGPFAKWNKYSFARKMKTNMDAILANFKFFIQKDVNIYGISIKQTTTVDTFLIAKKFITHTYPSTDEIYKHIQDLETHAQNMKASRTGYPMLNVTQTDTTEYHCMVAIPINKIIDDKKPVFFVRMVPGRFLRTDVTGGPQTIAHAHKMMLQYFEDYKRTAMAIPFEYLVTDRSKQPDTTKWITRIYGPVY
jgi:hypothetical protein